MTTSFFSALFAEAEAAAGNVVTSALTNGLTGSGLGTDAVAAAQAVWKAISDARAGKGSWADDFAALTALLKVLNDYETTAKTAATEPAPTA